MGPEDGARPTCMARRDKLARIHVLIYLFFIPLQPYLLWKASMISRDMHHSSKLRFALMSSSWVGSQLSKPYFMLLCWEQITWQCGTALSCLICTSEIKPCMPNRDLKQANDLIRYYWFLRGLRGTRHSLLLFQCWSCWCKYSGLN